jgi:MFS family permease
MSSGMVGPPVAARLNRNVRARIRFGPPWRSGANMNRPDRSRTAATLSYRAVVRIDGVVNLLLAASLARLAERMLGLVLVLYALERFQSPQLAGWVGFAALAPGLLVSPLAGALLDRVGATWAITADTACSAGCILVLALLAVAHADSAGSLLLLATLYAVTNPLSSAGIRTLLPSLVPPAAFGRANALDTSINAAVDVCGPALAGALFGFAGAAVALLAVAGLYAAACVALLPTTRSPARARRPPWRRGLLADAVAGVAHVLRHPTLRPLAVTYALYNMGWGILLVSVPVFVIRATSGSPRSDLLIGALWAASGVASAVGALLTGHYGGPGRERAMMALGMLATGVAIYPVCVWFGLPGLAVGLALVGFLAGPVDVGVLTLRQRRTEPAWLGRVMAVSMSLNMSGAPIGFALGGALAGWSVQAGFAVAGLACAAAALLSRFVPRG